MFTKEKPVSKWKKKKKELKIDSHTYFAEVNVGRTASVELGERGKKRPNNYTKLKYFSFV